jgi:hypothetical protein
MKSPPDRQLDSLGDLSDDFYEQRNLDDLSTDAQTLHSLLTLIVDIRYRVKYDEVIEYQRGKGYSNNIKDEEVLAGPVSPVDDALLGT